MHNNEVKIPLLQAGDIDVRVAKANEKGCSLVLYKSARIDMKILDEVFGPFNWQRTHQRLTDDLWECTLMIRADENSSWIVKQDVGTASNSEAEKGGCSDSFKRACVNVGIGRELYSAPFIWLDAKDSGVAKNNKGVWATNVKFAVKEIAYDEQDKISYLVICNARTGKDLYTFGKKPRGKDAPPKEPPASVTEEEKANPGAIKCTGGKYAGKTLEEIWAVNPNQIRVWAYRTDGLPADRIEVMRAVCAAHEDTSETIKILEDSAEAKA